jgi:hypothetical protein
MVCRDGGGSSNGCATLDEGFEATRDDSKGVYGRILLIDYTVFRFLHIKKRAKTNVGYMCEKQDLECGVIAHIWPIS